MHTIILLLATAGLRISEALRLTLEAVDLDQGVLKIHRTKFRKSRLVPVSPGTLAELRSYHAARLTVASTEPSAAFFVSGRGRAYGTGYVEKMFQKLAIQTGLRPPTGRGPHLHDLRSTFAVTRLLQWYREGANVMACLPRLSTYLGHACVADTEVYLRITTALLEEAGQRFHGFAAALLPSGGQP
jgi:integrase